MGDSLSRMGVWHLRQGGGGLGPCNLIILGWEGKTIRLELWEEGCLPIAQLIKLHHKRTKKHMGNEE
jgi:hypothetical protein